MRAITSRGLHHLTTHVPLRPLCAAILLGLAGLAQASTGLVISQVYGGGGSTSTSPLPAYKQDWIELHNTSNSALSLNGLSLQYGSATGNYGATASNIVTLPNVSLAAGQYYLVAMALNPANSTGADLPVTADLAGSANLSSSNGKVALVTGTNALGCGASTCDSNGLARVVDRVSYGSANNAEGSALAALSTTTSALRAQGGCTDSDNNASDFSVAASPTPHNTSTVAVICSGASGSSGTGTGGSAGGGGGGKLTPIYTIQGSGSTSPLVGQTVNTSGVVTKVNNNGFFLQDPIGDGNDDTSDGIFVYTGTAPTVSAGQAISLTGTVVEFNVGASTNTQTLAHTVTELNNPAAITVLGSGQNITPTVITLPVSDARMESLEGMLVTINNELTADQNYFLGRYGQITLSAGGRLHMPTNLYPAGSSAAIALAADNAQRSILLDDGSSLQNPNPTPYFAPDTAQSAGSTQRAGDTLPSLTGVVDYGLSTSSNTGNASYKIHPTQTVTFTSVNPRTAAPAPVGGNIKVASFNVLNFFTTFTDGTTADGGSGQACTLGGASSTANCRGADNLNEFKRQRAKIVKAIAAINPDVAGLMEIQNAGNTAVQNLVDALNAEMGANTYAAIGLPSPISGTGAATGTDAIRVAMIYKPASLSPVGSALSDINAINNRPPLAQTFSAANGEQFTLVVNHFKSKSCATGSDPLDTDQGDGQGCFNNRRTQQASELRSFLSALQTLRGDTDVLVIGDLNAYAKEDPILNLTANGLVDLIEAFNGSQDYSYVFDGQMGYIDHALASTSLSAQVSGTAHWHINADEPSVIDYNTEFKAPLMCGTLLCGPDYYTASPYRASDHDPVVIGLNLVKHLNGTARGETIIGTPGDDIITGGEGADVITGGAGRDVFVYNSMRDALDTITDFQPGEDRIDLTAIAAGLYAANPTVVDLVKAGFIQLVNTAAGVQVRIDTDGLAGPASARPLVTLRGLTAAQIQPSRDLIL